MKKLIRSFGLCCLATAAIIYLAGCDDDSGPQLTGETKTYDLGPVSNSAISGTVTFAERDDEMVVVTIELNGTQSGSMHPAHIHANTAAETGNIILDLNAVDGGTGKSETIVNTLNDGTPLTFEDLLAMDGYVNVHESPSNLATLIAQGDIGQNELTGDVEEYTLGPISDAAISGIATFAKRVNGETLVTVSLDGTHAGEVHPSHIHANSAAQGGGIVIDLNDVDGTTGEAKTNISKKNDGTAISYDEMINFNGYLNVHLSDANLGTLIAQGDIGQNELTGNNKVYTLNPVSDPAISGTVTFAERKNGRTLITISLVGTTAGNEHPAHIHANSAAQGGGIVLDLKNVNGATGKSMTSANALNNGTAITYTELLAYNGYVNVHLSAASLATLVAQGNIGSNAP